MAQADEQTPPAGDLDLDEVSRTYMDLGAKRGTPSMFRGLLQRTVVGGWLDDGDEGRARALERHLMGRAIGARPGRWGVLSGDETFHVEAALDRLDQALLRHRAPDDEGANSFASAWTPSATFADMPRSSGPAPTSATRRQKRR